MTLRYKAQLTSVSAAILVIVTLGSDWEDLRGQRIVEIF